MKPIIFKSNSLKKIKLFTSDVKQEIGYQLHRVQEGLEPYDWKVMKSIGAGVKEVRVKDSDGIYRVIYIAKFSDAVYVLHAFQKKTQKTSNVDLEIAKKALLDVLKEQKNG